MCVLSSAKKIFNDIIGDDIRTVKDKSKGANHYVYIFFCEKGNYVMRLPRRGQKSKLLYEAWAFEEWRKRHALVPRLYAADECYILEEYIDGIELADLKLLSTEKEAVYKDVGKQVKKLHSVKTQGYGPWDRFGVGKYLSWESYLTEDFENNMKEIFRTDFLSKSSEKKMRDYFYSNKEYMQCLDPRLLHNDLSETNIIIKDMKVNGMIDGSDCISGDPLYDLAVLYYNNRKAFTYVMDGYGKVDRDRIIFYCFYHMMWLLNYHRKHKLYKRCKQDVKSILTLIRENRLVIDEALCKL